MAIGAAPSDGSRATPVYESAHLSRVFQYRTALHNDDPARTPIMTHCFGHRWGDRSYITGDLGPRPFVSESSGRACPVAQTDSYHSRGYRGRMEL